MTVSIVACGGESTEEISEETTEVVKLKGFEKLDLSEWGFNLTVMVPKAEIHGTRPARPDG
ncbi:MAG: hypothetical protein JKY63_03365 [Rhodobiaceae bacterium]|nr:hypothetical protein [Rhodobiaceae bacterium]